MAWFLLVLAGLFEVGFTLCLKLSNNFTNWRWTVCFLVSAALSFFFLSKAIETLPLGTAYGVWTGIGTVGTALVGILLFREPTDAWRLFFLGLLVVAVVGLKLVSK